MNHGHPEREIDAVAAQSLARGDATGWFETVYAAGAAGRVAVPWNRPVANPLLTGWAAEHTVDGAGRSAVVIGCGLGRDAEFVAGLGFATVAFDIAETAVRIARDRNPGSVVDYRVADLLDPPASWSGFDLVVESYTVQALPPWLRAEATTRVSSLVAAGGTLLVIAAARAEDEPVRQHPPWPLTRAELDAFGDGLTAVRVEQFPDDGGPSAYRWRAEFSRAAAAR
jgi:SAM-dependent methyltransferase